MEGVEDAWAHWKVNDSEICMSLRACVRECDKWEEEREKKRQFRNDVNKCPRKTEKERRVVLVGGRKGRVGNSEV